MAVNKISLNSVESRNVSQVSILPTFPIDSISNQFDIFYHLGTNLNQSQWANPFNISVTASLTEGTLTEGNLNAVTGRSTSNGGYAVFNNSNTILQFEFLNNFEIDLQSYIIYNNTWAGTGYTAWIIEGSNNQSEWYKLSQVSNHNSASGKAEIYYCESRLGFFKYIRIKILAPSQRNFTAFNFFGKLRNLITGQATIESTKDIFSSYPSIDSQARYENTILRYDGTYWEPRTRFPYEVIKLNLTENYTITSGYKPTFYIISPNGADREILLPDSPVKDDVIKIKNVDGMYTLTIKENATDDTPITMNNSGKLQYEFVYDDVEWQVSG
jgi:hypothetical protein